jgi:hypothetical protein
MLKSRAEGLYHEKQFENNKTRSSDKAGFYSQSEHALDCI